MYKLETISAIALKWQLNERVTVLSMKGVESEKMKREWFCQSKSWLILTCIIGTVSVS